MKQLGIWIDKREAKIVSLKNGDEHIITIMSDLEEYNPQGGSGTKIKGGPQDVVQDSKYLEREKHQFSDFCKTLVPSMEDADAIVIFGPAQSGKKLHKELQEKHLQLFNKVISVEKADNMTENQLKAWVRDFYQKNK